MRRIALSIILVFAASLSYGQATEVGEAPISQGEVEQIDLEVYDGTPYVAFTDAEDERQIHLLKFNGNSWEEVGEMPPMAKTGDAIDLVFNGGIPHILFSNADGMTVAKFVEGEWRTEGKPGFAAAISTYDAQLCFVDGKATVVYENKTDDKFDMHQLEKNGNVHIWSAMDAIDGIPSGVEQPSITADKLGNTFLAWFDRANDKVGVAKVTDDGEGLEEMSKGIPGSNVSQFLGIKIVETSLYLAYEDKKNGYSIQIMKYDGKKGKWESVETGQRMAGEGFCMDHAGSIAYLDADKNVILNRYDAGAWKAAVQISAGESPMVKICTAGDQIYIAFIDGTKNNGLVVMKL